jgi:hypothetical protein
MCAGKTPLPKVPPREAPALNAGVLQKVESFLGLNWDGLLMANQT